MQKQRQIPRQNKQIRGPGLVVAQRVWAALLRSSKKLGLVGLFGSSSAGTCSFLSMKLDSSAEADADVIRKHHHVSPLHWLTH